jgi:LacI family transcriptional regulator
MNRKRNIPTIKDVAKEAGVSLGTVSKVINGKPAGEEYVRKVNAAIKKLDYHVNSYAQGLKASKTYTVAVILPNTYVPFFGELAHYINMSLQRRNYKMLLCCSDYDHRKEQDYIDMVTQNKVDGVIALTYYPDIMVPDDIPFVSIDRVISPNIPCVASDNFAGGNLAAEMLARKGCKKVALLRKGSRLDNEPNKRRSGFENGCIANNLDYDMKIIHDEEDNSEFFRFLDSHIQKGKLDFDGLFCVTDSIVYDVIEYLKTVSIYVPKDVQIIGFDGVRMHGDKGYYCSSIVQPSDKISEMCVELLLQDSMSIKPPLVCLPVSFVEGGTTL